ncbi:MAG: hypothetical protein ABL973_09915 [Micropepsaceae bacterium]
MTLDYAPSSSRASTTVGTQLWHPGCERERLELLELGTSTATLVPGARASLRDWIKAVDDLNEEACTTFSAEAALASLATEFRRIWLNVAHRSADRFSGEHVAAQYGLHTLRASLQGQTSNALEKRCASYAQTPKGWCSSHVLFSSWQGGLASVLHWTQDEGFWSTAHASHASFAGSDFETQDLLELFSYPGLTWSRPGTSEVRYSGNDRPSRMILIEPVFFDDGINIFDIEAFHQIWQQRCSSALGSEPVLIILNTTLTGTQFPLPRFLASLAGPMAPTVLNVHSGSRLDQVGLELASAGIVSVYHPERDGGRPEQIAGRLREIRSSTGVDLTFEDFSALEAPWFLDRSRASKYAQAVFRNNALFAETLSQKLQLFEQVLHPQFADNSCPWAKAPYCVLRLRNPSAENYEALMTIMAHECHQRGILFNRGASFGYRGHRYDVETPARARGQTFLRIAMGASDGPSCRAVIDLMKEFSDFETMSELSAAYPQAFQPSQPDAKVATHASSESARGQDAP